MRPSARRVRPDLAEDVQAEIEHHLGESADALMAQGWAEESAWSEARRRFGEVDGTAGELVALQRKGQRRARRHEWAWSIASDFRFAMRTLRGNPVFAGSVILTLALGAGAATAAFSVLDAVLLRPLPYADSDRLVEVHPAGRPGRLEVPLYEAWAEAGEPLIDGWVGFTSYTLARMDRGEAERLSVLAVTPGAQALLGIPILHGRGFGPEDVRSGNDVALLTGEYFARQGSDPSVIGQAMHLESGPVTVIGVLRPGIRFPDYGGERDLWIPIREDGTAAGRALQFYQGSWARLREGVSLDLARESIPRIAEALQSANPRERGWGVDLLPVGRDRATDVTEGSLWLLSGTVVMILLIALMNSANLLGIRTLARSRELGIRAAIGGSRWRIARQLLVEGMLLGLVAGGASVVLAWLTLKGIDGLVPETLDFWSVYSLGIERRTLLFAFAATLGAGTILGLVPAASVVRSDGFLRSRTAMDDTRAARRARSALVIGQVMLSMTLLAGGALFVGSFLRLARVDPGFDFRQVALADLELSAARYPTDRDRAEYLARLEEALETHPAVEGASTTGGGSNHVGVALEAEGSPPPPNQPDIIPFTTAGLGYLSVTGTELVAGRDFEPTDARQNVAIVDADLARFLWGTERVVGRRFRVGENEWQEVIGVARDLRMLGRDQRKGPYQILYPRSPDEIWEVSTLWVRTSGDPRALLTVIRDAARSLDPEQTFWRLRTGEEALGEAEQTQRFLAVLMGLLASTGVALAGVGVFGVLAYSVGRRARELGVRKALGAGDGRLLAMVLRDGMALGGVGIILGIASALAIAGVAESLLYEVDPRDPMLLTAASVLFLLVIAAASLLPAKKATRVDPLEVLRAE